MGGSLDLGDWVLGEMGGFVLLAPCARSRPLRSTWIDNSDSKGDPLVVDSSQPQPRVPMGAEWRSTYGNGLIPREALVPCLAFRP